MELKQRFFKKIKEDAILPQRSTIGSAGYDFFSCEDIVIEPHEIKLVHTGVLAFFPKNNVLELYNRSSNPIKKGLILANGVGVVDSDYYGNADNDGEIMFCFYNIKNEPVTIKKGDKIGQGVFSEFFLVDDDNSWQKRTGGWGSTGN